MHLFSEISLNIKRLILEFEPSLLGLSVKQISKPRNKQGRNIKQIVGHLIDSASNNTHRIIHMQYNASPCQYPDYANLGNNDKWIAIQNFENEDWDLLINTFKYCNFHIAHVIDYINVDCINNKWISALNTSVTLKEMVEDYPNHLQLHLSEIQELMGK